MGKLMLSKEDKEKYQAILLLEYMINHRKTYSVLLDGDQKFLEDVLGNMMLSKYVDVKGTEYVPTETGRKVIENFYQRLYDFQMVFDVFSKVDLKAGEFAMESYFDFDNDDDYNDFLDDDRWEDCRIAVCEFKKMNVLEIVFLIFLNEGRFNFEDGWEFNLKSGLIFDEMIRITNSQLTAQQIEEAGNENGMENVLETMIPQGIECIQIVKQQEKDFEAQAAIDDAEDEEYYEEEIIVVEEVYVEDYYVDDYGLYYDPWYDPFYVAPIWYEPVVVFY